MNRAAPARGFWRLRSIPGAIHSCPERSHEAQFTAVTRQDSGVWIGWIEEVPRVNCQEDTRDALLESLRVTLAEALAFNNEEALVAT